MSRLMNVLKLDRLSLEKQIKDIGRR